MKRHGLTLMEVLVVLAIIIILISITFSTLGGCSSTYYKEKQTAVYQCVKAYTVTIRESSSKRVDLRPVSGGMVETFVVDDDAWAGIHNSATIFAQFEGGKWYSVNSIGHRREGAFSMFPLVTGVTEIPDPRK